MLGGGLVMGVLLYVALGVVYKGNLDIILPVVMFGAVVWGRLTQTIEQARRLALRGFGVTETQRGLTAILAERDAERAQLRADARVVARRRKQVIVSVLLFAATFVMKWYVFKYQRVQIRPDWYGVKLPGSIILYAIAVIRGLTIVSLVRSPLRRPPGEVLMRAFWLGPLGRGLLRAVARRVGVGSTGRTSGFVTIPVTSALVTTEKAAPTATVGAASGDVVTSAQFRQLEARVDALERRRAP